MLTFRHVKDTGPDKTCQFLSFISLKYHKMLKWFECSGCLTPPKNTFWRKDLRSDKAEKLM